MAGPLAWLARLREGLENRLFDPSPGSTPQALFLRALAYPYAVLRDLAGGQLTLRATGLVYATLLAIIPGVALSFVLLKSFGIHNDLAPLIHEFFRPLGGSADAITERVLAFADNVSSGLVGSVGFVLLVWTLFGTVKRVEDSFNHVWRVRVARSFGRRMAEYAVLLLAAPLLVASVVWFTTLAVRGVHAVTPEQVPLLAQVGRLLVRLAPYGIVTLLFMALYVVIPNTRVRPGPALIGALCAGVLWALVGRAFTLFVLYTSRLTLVYAGFAVIVAVLLWTYLGWLILLAGAQLSFYVQNPSYLRMGLTPLHLSNREKERLALNLMVLAARRARAGGPALKLDQLARVTGVPPLAMAPVIETLEEAGLVSLGRREEMRLMRAPEAITAADIMAAVRLRRRGHRLLRVTPLPAVEELQQRLEATLGRQLDGLTLADLVREEEALEAGAARPAG